ncbi:7-cyano-7-deazaguanine synthase [Mesorhizobium kowhaii]|uniref:7-cyano-7-deazaguanine synthase n=1 Tax=Mesorhizobium kowhaii TaxID=1300272 RepID=UPI0035E6AAC1
MIDMAALGQVSDIALTRDDEIATKASSQPNTFVPGRNLLFLDFADVVLPEGHEVRRHRRLPRRIIRVTRDCRDTTFGRCNLR